MSQRKLVSYGTILWIALGLVVATGYFYWTRGVYVRITNNTPSLLRQIDIVYRPGVVHIAALEPNASCSRHVNPEGESDLILKWLDSSGTEHSQAIGGYIEHNYSGSIEVTIEPNDTISVTDRVKSSLLP